MPVTSCLEESSPAAVNSLLECAGVGRLPSGWVQCGTDGACCSSSRPPMSSAGSISDAGAAHAKFCPPGGIEKDTTKTEYPTSLTPISGRHLAVRPVDQERNRSRWYGRRGPAGGYRRLRRKNRRDWRSQRQRQANHRRGRLCRGAGLHRSAHALRRADFLGCRPDAVAVARRDQCRDGQLRGGHRAVPDCRPRDRHARSRQCRSHSLRRAATRHHLGMGDLSAVHGCGRASSSGREPRASWRRLRHFAIT